MSKGLPAWEERRIPGVHSSGSQQFPKESRPPAFLSRLAATRRKPERPKIYATPAQINVAAWVRHEPPRRAAVVLKPRCGRDPRRRGAEFACALSRTLQKPPVKKLTALILLAFASSFGFAADSACMAAAKERKLAGAAQKSFVTKCETDAKAKCEAAAADKKLAGAAKASSVNKCVRETGPAA
jgi:hypothetical protein